MPQTTPNCIRPPYPIPKTLSKRGFLCPGQRRTKNALGFWEEMKLTTKKRNRMRKVLPKDKLKSQPNRVANNSLFPKASIFSHFFFLNTKVLLQRQFLRFIPKLSKQVLNQISNKSVTMINGFIYRPLYIPNPTH